jgi:hypothetical protein
VSSISSKPWAGQPGRGARQRADLTVPLDHHNLYLGRAQSPPTDLRSASQFLACWMASTSATSLPTSASANPAADGGAPAVAAAPPPGLDERMYFSRETGTWRLEGDDGNEMEYDTAKAAWVPVVS